MITKDEFETWALVNGWSPWCNPPEILSGNAWQIPSRIEGVRLIVHFLKRNIRIVAIHDNHMVNRIMTVHPSRIKMEQGVPRGMGLWTSPYSPFFHKKGVSP